MQAIQPVHVGQSMPVTSTAAPATNADTFRNLLINGLEQVDNSQAHAEHAVQHLVGQTDANPADVLTAVQRADLSLNAMIQIRNQLERAYEELKSIRV